MNNKPFNLITLLTTRNNITQKELAKQSGLTQYRISRLSQLNMERFKELVSIKEYELLTNKEIEL